MKAHGILWALASGALAFSLYLNGMKTTPALATSVAVCLGGTAIMELLEWAILEIANAIKSRQK